MYRSGMGRGDQPSHLPHTCFGPFGWIRGDKDKLNFQPHTFWWVHTAYIRNKNKWPTLVKIKNSKTAGPPNRIELSRTILPNTLISVEKKMLVSKGSYFRINVHLRFLMRLIINHYKSIKFNNKHVRYTKLPINTKIICGFQLAQLVKFFIVV